MVGSYYIVYKYIYCTCIIHIYIYRGIYFYTEMTGQWHSSTTVWNEIGFLSKIILTWRIGGTVYIPTTIIIIIIYVYIYIIYNVCVYILWVLIIFKNVIQTPDVGGRHKTNFLAGPIDLHSRPARAITSGWGRETTDRRSVTLISNNHKPNDFSTALRSLGNKRSNNNNDDNSWYIYIILFMYKYYSQLACINLSIALQFTTECII